MEQTNHTDYLPNTEAIAAPQPARPDIFVNRELSWLEFNHRVLSESLNPNIPLMERLKFLSIYFSNLDEFFMVRVGSLHDQSILEPDKLDDKTGLNAAGQIAAIRRKVEAINPIAERAWSSLRQLLSTQDIEVLDIHHMSKIDEQIVQNYFNNEIRPLLSPQLIDRQHPFPFLKNKEQLSSEFLIFGAGTDRQETMGETAAFSRAIPRRPERIPRNGSGTMHRPRAWR